MSATLTVTAKGQVTLRKELLRHLGIGPGEKVEVSLLPDGRAELRAAKKPGSIEDFFGSPAAILPTESSPSPAARWAVRFSSASTARQ